MQKDFLFVLDLWSSEEARLLWKTVFIQRKFWEAVAGDAMDVLQACLLQPSWCSQPQPRLRFMFSLCSICHRGQIYRDQLALTQKKMSLFTCSKCFWIIVWIFLNWNKYYLVLILVLHNVYYCVFSGYYYGFHGFNLINHIIHDT